MKLFQPFLFLLLISGISFSQVTTAFAEEEEKEIDITLSPKETLFDISNMKPGDWAPRTLTVINSGSKDFEYRMELQNNGDLKLFNELLLEIESAGQKLYDGKLTDFTSTATRKLISGSEENLELTIRFPEHLGNDFQGVQSAFTFTFTAEGKDQTAVSASTKGLIDSGNVKTNGFNLPQTGVQFLNMLIAGSVLIAGGLILLFVKKRKKSPEIN